MQPGSSNGDAEPVQPCSSNGDAAASLAAAFALAPLFPQEGGPDVPSPAPPPPLPTTGTVSQRPEGGDVAWRLKFLNKVGIPDARSAREAPPELGRSTALRGGGGLDSEEDGGASAEEVVVVKQEAPARRSSDDIRLGYIKKLEHSRAFIPQLNRPKSSQTVTIFDWDDTLLCTSHLEMVQRQYGAIPAQVREQLASLQRIVQTLLRQADKNGKVFIITNASEGWVQHSSSLCMPGLEEDLSNVRRRRSQRTAPANAQSVAVVVRLVPWQRANHCCGWEPAGGNHFGAQWLRGILPGRQPRLENARVPAGSPRA